MKTLILMLSIIALPISTTYAALGDDKSKKEVDTTKVAKEKNEDFKVEIKDGTLTVIANGDFDKYASISLATHRGSDIYFEFLKDGNNSITFNTQSIETGSYFVVLNSNDEVRIKRIQL